MDDDQFTSKEAFEKACGSLLAETVSAVPGVKILVSTNGSIALLSEESDKVLAKHVHLGGFGGGGPVKKVTAHSPTKAIPYAFDQQDKTLIEYEESGATGNFSVNTLYCQIRRLESEGKINLKISFATIERRTQNNRDALLIKQSELFEFKLKADDGREEQTHKTVFSKKASKDARAGGLSPKKKVAVVYRFRLEPIGCNLTPTKPHVATAVPIRLKKGLPMLM